MSVKRLWANVEYRQVGGYCIACIVFARFAEGEGAWANGAACDAYIFCLHRRVGMQNAMRRAAEQKDAPKSGRGGGDLRGTPVLGCCAGGYTDAGAGCCVGGYASLARAAARRFARFVGAAQAAREARFFLRKCKLWGLRRFIFLRAFPANFGRILKSRGRAKKNAP